MVATIVLAAACGGAPLPTAPRPSLATTLAVASPARSASTTCVRESKAACNAPSPDFPLDVKPILERRCLPCHAGDGDAAESHDFSRFETLHAQRLQLADEVRSCSMPPPGTPELTDGEANTLLRWVACGAVRR